MGYKIFTHEIHSEYAARIDNFRSYDAVSKDILQRWTYPLVPDIPFSSNGPPVRLDHQEYYKEAGWTCINFHFLSDYKISQLI